MLRFSTAQYSVPAIPGRLRAQWNVRVTEPDFLYAVRWKQTRALSPKHSFEKTTVGRSGDC